jgi:hypothetical protein
MGIYYINNITHKNTGYRGLIPVVSWVGVHYPLWERENEKTFRV